MSKQLLNYQEKLLQDLQNQNEAHVKKVVEAKEQENKRKLALKNKIWV